MKAVRYVYHVVEDAFYTFLADDGWAIASHIALSTLMALFPFLIVLTSLAGFFGSKIGIEAPAVTLLYHLLYGLVLGVTYGLLARAPFKKSSASKQIT